MNIGEITMTEDDGIGIALLQVFEDEQQGYFLLLCSGVIVLPFFIDTSFVTHADAMIIKAYHMSTSLCFRAPRKDVAITVDVPVITYPTPALGLVPAVDVRHADTLAQWGGGAVHHDVPHFLHHAHGQK